MLYSQKTEKGNSGMTKAEFIQTLREKLMGEVSSTEIENTIRYYEDYIEDAKRKGRSEDAVLEELGSPLLIAHTIIDTASQTSRDRESVFEEASGSGHQESRGTFRQYDFNSAKVKIIAVLVLVLVLFLIFTILRVLIPIVVPVLVVLFIFRMIQRGGRR